MCSAAAVANTMHSSKELLAIRFAPCKPVKLDSPMAYRCGKSVMPCVSVMIPPQV